VRFSSPECIWRIEAELAEGPVWQASEEALYFVDIKGRMIHRCSDDGAHQRSWQTPAAIGFLQPRRGGGFVAGLKTGLHLFDAASGIDETPIIVEPSRPENRLNDAYVDAAGQLWFGSMDDQECDPTGSLYRLDTAGTIDVMDSDYVITNGPSMSPDGKVFYHTDTLAQIVYAYDIADDNSLANKRVFIRIEGNAYPDGTTVDASGCLWIGLFCGSRIVRYSPSGALIETIPMPCANITKVAFGGKDLCTVFATTAWKGLSAAERAKEPLAGSLFAFRVDTPGLAQHQIAYEF
jgi:xylono-1,5-lactonase